MRPSTTQTTASSPSASPVALVVGASSGIGRATAHLLAERDARLLLAARDAERLDVVADECRARGAAAVGTAPLDVTDGVAVEAAVARLVREHGRVDLVVASAALMAYGRIEDVPAEVFGRVVDVTVTGTATIARTVLPVLRRQDGGGVLVVVTSLLSSVPVPVIGSYVTAKWAQLGLVRVLQLETRDAPDVHVCAVAPGAVDTPIYRHAARFGIGVPQPPPPVDRPEKVARAVVACLDRPRRSRSVGLPNRVVIAGFRLLPALFHVLVGPLFAATLSKDGPTHADGNLATPRHDDEGGAPHGAEDGRGLTGTGAR